MNNKEKVAFFNKYMDKLTDGIGEFCEEGEIAVESGYVILNCHARFASAMLMSAYSTDESEGHEETIDLVSKFVSTVLTSVPFTEEERFSLIGKTLGGSTEVDLSDEDKAKLEEFMGTLPSVIDPKALEKEDEPQDKK